METSAKTLEARHFRLTLFFFSLYFGLVCLPALRPCGLLRLGAGHPRPATVLRSGVLVLMRS